MDITESIGTVIRTTGSWYRILTLEGRVIDCTLRGKIRLKGLKSTNPIAIGDRVTYQWEKKDESGQIISILPRKNYILRKAVKLSSQFHILCANIDQALLIATLEDPFTPLGFIDRFLVSCEAFHIPVVILLNKADKLNTDKLKDKAADYLSIYRNIGYKIELTSGFTAVSAEKIRNLLQGKTSFLGGHSGVGKSTLINLVDPDLQLKTGEISTFSGKGKHTTTFAEMFPLSFGGFVIDAPGFKEMELFDFQRNEISHYFPEMRDRISYCKFNDCTHTEEPGCAIKEAVESGEIAESRYHTYLGMLSENLLNNKI
jgi:ribosome biogenesis GTPase